MFRNVIYRWILMLAFCTDVYCRLSAQQIADTNYIRNIALDNQRNKQRIQSLDSAVNELRREVQISKQLGFENFVNTSFFLDAAISTCNNLNILIYKESYRNKISSLNNPAGNELGFNLQAEIQSALKPLLQKVRKTDPGKFSGVVESILKAGAKTTGASSSVNIFNSIISLVGTLAVSEKKITKEDLEKFIKTVEKYFEQYEKLYQSNLSFSNELEKLKEKIKYQEADIKSFLVDVISAFEKKAARATLKKINAEELMIQYFDMGRLKDKIKAATPGTRWNFPLDAVRSCKDIAAGLQRLYDEYASVYNANYNEIRGIVNETKSIYTTVDQSRLNKTLKELEGLYVDSREADNNSLRMKTLSARLEQFSNIN